MNKQIHYYKSTFDFSSLNLGRPYNDKSSGHIMKYSINDIPVYYQPPKCTLKTGFIKSGKSFYCDMIFSMEDDLFFTWLENLEEKSRNLIYENRAKWFDTDLEMEDIENTMTSPFKMYKSGKYFIVRASVPTTLGNCDLKIYDENEKELNYEELKEDMQTMVILEFKGIKCLSRGFVFEIKLKQMLVVRPVKLFEKCLIIPSKDLAISEKTEKNEKVELPKIDLIPSSVIKEEEAPLVDESSADNTISTTEINQNVSEHEESIVEPDLGINEPIEILDDFIEPDNDVDEPILLKNRRDVYYKMYKDARQKAREAKIVALTNYLESKRIKNEYFLENISEDDDSDLENLINIQEQK